MKSLMTIQDISLWIKTAAPSGQLTSDSRRVQRGDVFFAYAGATDFITAAIEQGAAAIVHDAVEWNAAWSQVPHLLVSDLKRLAGPVAHAFYGMPDSAMFSAGVTGTNGKTSCALWLAQALARLGVTSSVIGTLGVGLCKPRVPGPGRSTTLRWQRPWHRRRAWRPVCAPAARRPASCSR